MFNIFLVFYSLFELVSCIMIHVQNLASPQFTFSLIDFFTALFADLNGNVNIQHVIKYLEVSRIQYYR